MATVKDEIQNVKNLTEYVKGSFYIKSADDDGMVIKWLEENASPTDGTSNRKERFIEMKKSESKTIPRYRKRTAVYTVDVNNPI